MDLTLVSKTELEVAGCLRRLMRHRYILRSNNVQWFQRISDHRLQLQKVLDAFFLQLIVDESLGVSYISEADPDIEESLAFQISRKKRLGAYSTLLLIQLRHERLQFYLNPKENAVPMVSKEQLREYLKGFDTHQIEARFETAFKSALQSLRDLQVLSETKVESGNYEITAICDLLVPQDEIQSLRQKIQTYFSEDESSQLQEEGRT
ncbi:DUF4194 domain-containing protein [bacterium]|nr:DUF4194 domain-containing protein [bacterium]